MRAVRILLALLILHGSVAAANDTSRPPLADQVKAAFIFKFCSYIEWPPEIFSTPQSPIVIATFERDASMAHLLTETVRGRRVGERPVQVRTLSEHEVTEGIHVLYLGDDTRLVRSRIESVKGQPILIVTDLPRGLEFGSGINFRREDDRIRFDISLTAAQSNRLKISSRLLTVARQIEGAEP
ncbi:hypothetical protein GCM10011352_16800 [Marinobacterium zhoushanense]|uniref:YfiR family protein n=1 Tax=Marinobacterium zhoushanense TaxID=1679163 RepID=A0ABQ1KCH8_9GAMM|nr:YfiR family protein [Marinobacterium zhoushanense]GGB91388.1 hypothetical protein GCM10011352_16800 [Marinobacterium zhoushanense]